MFDFALFDGSCAICGSNASESDRIQSAVDALNNCLLTIDKAAAFPSKDYFLNQQITKALAILEGRDQSDV